MEPSVPAPRIRRSPPGANAAADDAWPLSATAAGGGDEDGGVGVAMEAATTRRYRLAGAHRGAAWGRAATAAAAAARPAGRSRGVRKGGRKAAVAVAAPTVGAMTDWRREGAGLDDAK